MEAEAAPAQSQPKAKIFISYSRKDMAFADRLEAALKDRGFEPLIDRTEIYAFEDWWKRIQALIGRADTMVFVLSPDAVASDVALKEVTYAASLNKRFAPIVCRRAADDVVPEPLRRLNFIFFDEPTQFEASADRLAEALQTDIGWIRQHTDFGEAARRWASAGRPTGLLLRSPALEGAERWIATRPRGAPEPTSETQAYVIESRRGTSRRRNVLTGSLAAGLVVALALAGVAYWQRGIAVEQRQIAELQRKRAEDTLAAATQTANSLVFDLARRFRESVGVPANLIKDILSRAFALQDQLIKSGQMIPELKRSEAATLAEIADVLLAIGDTAGARTAAEQSLQIATDLVAGDPTNTHWRRDLSVSYDKIGDVLVVQGKLDEALKSYRDSLAVVERLAQSDPGNTDWQRDLSVSYNKIGDVLVAHGQSQEALKSYRDSLAIRERLAATDRGNAQWQRDLSVSYENIGNVLLALGNLEEALKAYRDGLAIREQLAAADRNNTRRQRDLYVSYIKVGDVLVAQGKLEEALKAYRESLAIAERLAAADRSSAQWPHDLSVSYNKIGDVLAAQGELDEALKSYRDCFAIAERLAAADSSNAQWQHDLAVSHSKLAQIYERQGRIADALQELILGRDIITALVAIAPGNMQRKSDLYFFEQQIARLQGRARAQ
jgi:tetratricopeptide (TPR) repeat protein